jgi:hypothetical protein
MENFHRGFLCLVTGDGAVMGGKLAGTDLCPLAFESELSILLRIAWRNAFDAKLMREHFSSRRIRFHFCRKRLAVLLGWTVEEEELTGDYYSWFTIFFIAPLFRYCPICLEGGYHSYLYQCLEIRCCPIHDIPLSMECQCCGETTIPYRAYEAWFIRPYFCSRCGQPISGAEPVLEAHLDFRVVEHSVEETLRPHFQSWQQSGPARFSATQGGPVFSTARSTWAERAALMRGMDDLIKREDPSLRALRGLQFNWSERTLGGAQIDESMMKCLLWAQSRGGFKAAEI